jgi:hypothetical protein
MVDPWALPKQEVLVLAYDNKSILFKLQATGGNHQHVAVECHLNGPAMLWAT